MKYDQTTAIKALLRGEAIPTEWMDELTKIKTLDLSGNQIVDVAPLAALSNTTIWK